MKIISELTEKLAIKYRRLIYTSTGMIFKEGQGWREEFTLDRNLFVNNECIINVITFCEQIENHLDFYKVKIVIDDENDLLYFSKLVIAKLIYNGKYNEVNFVSLNNEYSIIHILHTLKSTSQNILENYLHTILSKEDFYEELFIIKGIGNLEIRKLFYFYTRKFNKFINFLLENDRTELISSLFSNEEEGNIDIPLSKNAFKIFDCLLPCKLSLFTAIKLANKYQYSDFEKFFVVLEKLNLNGKFIWEIITEINYVSLNDIANYYIKIMFTNGFDIIKKDLDVGIRDFSTLKNRGNEFLKIYRDYLNMVVIGEDDLFPENIITAHEEIIGSFNERVEREKAEKKQKEFNEKVSMKDYSNLQFKKDEYEIVVPKTAADLVEEGKNMHHCVGTYVDSVSKGISKICMLRKLNTPYMTIEVKENKIVQAKKAYNEIPNLQDEEFLTLWANKKELIITSY